MQMTGYTKLFGSIVASTIWRESKETKIVWITMLAMANKQGNVEASIPGLADMARVTIPECEKALEDLLSTDKYSRTKEHEGRRIEAIDGGWAILNHAKYRAKMSIDERREYLTQKQREHREKIKGCQHGVNNCQQPSTESTQAEASPEAEPKKGLKNKATAEEVADFFAAEELPDADAEWFFNKCVGCGWTNGGKPIKDWKATVRSWRAAGYLPSQKKRNGTKPEFLS